MNVISGLNSQQAKAVKSTEGPILVFAGAGSGKTRVLTYRIAYLLKEKKVPPENILAVTFTNKAAKEMKGRVCSLLNDTLLTTPLTISTFHALGLKILKREASKVGYSSNFVIFTPYEQSELLKRVMKEENVSTERFSPKVILSAVSKIKNNPDIADDPAFLIKNINFSVAKKILDPFNKAMLLSGAMDFDDLILKTVYILKENPEVLEKYSQKFKYILVDEYQDTNFAQFELIKLLSSRHQNIFVVGDDDQSIYGWRGARVENILNFQKEFSNCKTIKLEQNYRSVADIVESAGRLISKNCSRMKKTSFTNIKVKENEGIKVIEKPDENSEAEFVSKEILKMMDILTKPSEIAVIIRANYQSKPFEMSFRHYSIPYIMIGGQKFYENKEIKDIVAYLRIIVNPYDEISLRRIINYPPRKIGSSTQEKLLNISKAQKKPPLLFLLQIDKYPDGFTPEQISALNQFKDLYLNLSNLIKKLSPVQFAKDLVSSIAIEDEIKKSSESETIARIRVENIDAFINSVATDPLNNAGYDTVSFYNSFINSIALMQSGEEETKNNSVNIITAHSAKGLEFDTVFIPGFYQGGMPNSLAIEEGNIEEERRLAYVAMTRAKKRLFIIIPHSVSHRGNIRAVKPSVFLNEAGVDTEKHTGIPEDPLKMLDEMLKKIRDA